MPKEYQPTNREKKLAPKKGKAWCDFCDGDLVADGAKCRRCGRRHPIRRFKKKDQ